MQTIELIFIALISATAQAGEISFFDSKIDFWGDKEKLPSPLKVPMQMGSDRDEKFSWNKYLDPKNKEFFKEGDYTPPEPFIEIARNPTDENIKNWFEFMQKKNELARRLDERLREYLAKNGGKPQAPTLSTFPPSKTEIPVRTMLDSQRFKVRMYFESTCPHCRRMFGVLKRLQDEGVNVHALQIDRGPVQETEKLVPVDLATPEEIKKHGISTVPFVVIADTKRKVLLSPVRGYHDFEEMIDLLKKSSQ